MVKIVDTKSYVNESKRTIVTVIEDEIGNEFRGQSYCSVDDEFDKDFGEKLAYLRAKRKMIRYYRGIYEHNLKNAREQMTHYEEKFGKEINKHNNILEKVENAIDEMLNSN